MKRRGPLVSYIIICLKVLFLIVLPTLAFSQTDTIPSQNPEKVAPRRFFYSERDSIFTSNDTIVVKREIMVRDKDTLTCKEENGKELCDIITRRDTIVISIDTLKSSTEKVLEGLQRFTKRRNPIARLLSNILVFEHKENSPAVNPEEKSEQPFDQYEGMPIRNVNIKVLNVFGTSITNPERRPSSFFEKTGNSFHIKTHNWVIRNRLLFKNHDVVDPFLFSESERLLRSTNFIYDARIFLKSTSDEDSVDVTVVVQDMWSLSGSVDVPRGLDVHQFSLRDNNFAGLGQQWYANVLLDPRVPDGYHLRTNYFIQNIYKGLVNSDIYYNYVNGLRHYGFGINKDFQTTAIKWIGGVNTSFQELWPYNLPPDSFTRAQKISLYRNDFWMGHVVPVFTKNLKEDKGTRMVITARAVREDFYNAVPERDTLPFIYKDTRHYLGSIGFINRRFYKDKYIFRLGRTEDVPVGHLLSLTYGVRTRPGIKDPYLGINSVTNKMLKGLGYFSLAGGIGGYYTNQGWKEGLMYLRYLYFTPLIKMGNWRLRNYLSLRYTNGIQRLAGESVHMNMENGIRGFNRAPLRGTQRQVINLEANFYPPLDLLGFKMAFIAFADLGWIGNDKLFTKENFFPGYGIGFRFRNEHLVFDMVQIMLAYYPKATIYDAQNFHLYERTRFFYNFFDFHYTRPYPEQYQ